MYLRAIFFLFCITAFMSCKSDISTTAQVDLPKDFMPFYEKFNADSTYQLAHIQFPMAGIPGQGVDDPSLIEEFKWTPENWVIHKKFDNKEDLYVQTFIPLDSTLIIETIRMKTNDYGLERRFYKSNGEWYLIYYAALNRLTKNPEMPSSPEESNVDSENTENTEAVEE